MPGMLFLADENVDADIVRALRRWGSSIDIMRVQEVGLGGADDPTVLAWAAAQGRVLVTHDVNTITRYAYERLGRGGEAGAPRRHVRTLRDRVDRVCSERIEAMDAAS
jgi:hypothetical protein